MLSIDDFKKVEIRAGKIVSAERLEKSDKLLKLSVDFGESSYRTVVSGIAKFVEPDDLVQNMYAFVTNLEPREIMGFPSEAMILAVSSQEEVGDLNKNKTFSLLKIDNNIPAGSIVK